MYSKISTLFLVFLFCSPTFAQITIEATDMPVIGDNIPREVDTLTTEQPGPAGPNQSWDFSGALSHLQPTTSVVDPATTPYTSDFPGSNQAMTNDNQSFLYFSNSSSEMITDGAAGDLLMNGDIIVTPFPDPLKIHNFPRNYQDNFIDTYEFDVTVDGSGFGGSVDSVRLRHNGTVYDTTDGWGTVTTNVGTYDCLRIKSVEHSIDSVWAKLVFPPSWIFVSEELDTSTSYSWMAKETKLAVVELSFDSLDQPDRLTYSQIPPMTTGISSDSEKGIYVFPNPSSGMVNINIGNADLADEDLVMNIYDNVGRLVESRQIPAAGQQQVRFDLTGNEAGIYHLQIHELSGKSILRKKIILTKN